MSEIKAEAFRNTLEGLTRNIFDVNKFFLNRVQQQVNTALTLRNWLIGFYIIEYEQSGFDRAQYGAKLCKEIAGRLLINGIKSIRERHLYLCKDLYLAYPQIVQTQSAQSYLKNFQRDKILRTLCAELSGTNEFNREIEILVSTLSFSHFIELLKTDTEIQRRFYEQQAIMNNWSVRDLKRAIDSLLYERIGMTKNPVVVTKKLQCKNEMTAENLFKNTYLLEFLGLEEKEEYSESELEERIITNLQHFLLELGRGFCFEHRQKRITFGNTHYSIDLVFYHRILKCHVLLDLKIGEFDHSDAGQMNMYLNYYNENECSEGDNTPIGIILCSNKNESLVKYATAGLAHQVFVSKYLINLPTEKELKHIIDTGLTL